MYTVWCYSYTSSLLSIFPSSSLLLPVPRTLFKFMKKFEAVLSEPCQSSLVESDKEDQPGFLPQPTEAATSEASPIQNLNKALRETLLARPVAAQVLAWGIVFLMLRPVRWDYVFCVKNVLRTGEEMPLNSCSLDVFSIYMSAWPRYRKRQKARILVLKV